MRMRPGRRTWAMVLCVIACLGIARVWPKPSLASRYGSSTAVFDDRGRLLRLTLARDDRYRLWLPLNRIAPDIPEAFMLKEDRWFYIHPGVNPLALARGGWRTYAVSEPRQGGSTITMQLARLMDHRDTRTLWGKALQVARALQLEVLYSKREILEAYLNLVPFGANVEGVGAASLIYFGKPVSGLSLSEVMALAVIPQSPVRRAPGAAPAPGLVEARLRLFNQWVARHPDAEPQRGLVALTVATHGIPDLPFSAPHAVNAMLSREGVRGGEIHSTIDMRLQNALERKIKRYIEQQQRIGISNAAAVLVDYRSMEVKAVVGSANFFDAGISGQVNGTTARRSPGSTLKPFIYALAMDQGLIHPMSVLKDAPTAFGPFSPENFDGGFVGPITAHDALIRSRNVPAVALAAQLSSPSLYGFLQEGGVSDLAPEKHYGLALALGGGEVSMEELATLYAVLANRGVWRPLRTRIDMAEPMAGTRLLSEESSFMVMDILRDNPRPEGEAAGAVMNMPVAWKTGTSWGFRDAWSAGIFGPYVLVVWVGNFSGEGNPAFVGVQAAAPLFFRIVDAVAAEQPGLDREIAPFRVPPRLARVEVCAASGDLPNAYCPRKVMSWYIPGRSPIRVSTVHRQVMVDTRTGRLACPPYDPVHTRAAVYEYWPSDILKLYAQAGMPRRPPPAGDCSAPVSMEAAGAGPLISSPLRGATYMTRASHPERNLISFAASADADVATLYWFVNDSFVGSAKPGSAVAWRPAQPGSYVVRVVDERGRADARDLIITAAP